ncbi:hypothetical protein I7I51_08612 [Histoplasma capsulatum]|uniref:C2H2-type domain-containing protein n=1 Tax=Ajellomyces capsulatus TaxID=5037 RepID=A0A8A1M1B0_AJECA|nr:hypothetical protein I7I51_08612 [Histoplasma capsulatum]
MQDLRDLLAVPPELPSPHPDREFEEGRRMKHNADIATTLELLQGRSETVGDSAYNNMGNEITAERASDITSLAVKATDREASRRNIGNGSPQACSPPGGDFSIQVLKPAPPNTPDSDIQKGEGLIDINGPDGPDEKQSDLDKAVDALIASIRKRTQQEEHATLVKVAEDCMPPNLPSTVSDQVKNDVPNETSESMGAAKSERAVYNKKTENTGERMSPGSRAPTRIYTPQSENSDRIKRVKHNGTKPSGGPAVSMAVDPFQPHQGSESKQQENPGVRIICFDCDVAFSTLIGLQHHQIMYEHNYCKVCLSFFNDRSLFEHHIQLVHNFKCIECALTYKTWEEKAEHQRQTGHGYCKECSSYFLDRESHAKHLSLHKSTKFACPICNASFGTEQSRVMHQTATKHAYCNECGRYFQDGASYAKHVNVHNATSFACHICGMGFMTEDHRDAHQRERNHGVCSQCEAVFVDKVSEKSHKGVAHKHKCQIRGCKLSFSTPDLLATHKAKSHHFCRICTRTFVDKTALLNHERTSAKHAKPQVMR